MIIKKLLALIVIVSVSFSAYASLDLSLINTSKDNQLKEDICINYERINPAIYVVNVDCSPSNYILSFKDLYHPGWRVYYSLKSGESSSDLNYSLNELYLSTHLENDQKTYQITKGFKPSISDTILLTEDLHFRLNDMFNGWIIDSDLIRFLNEQNEVDVIDNNIQFKLYLVFYSEIIKQVWLKIMFVIIGFILSILLFKKFIIRRD